MSDISDPGRASRGDRKRAQKLIDAAYAAGQLTAANRAFRTERVDSAHTKGDLAILVRDLGAGGAVSAAATGATVQPPAQSAPLPTDPTAGPSTASLGSAIPPEQLKAMAKGRSAAKANTGESLRSTLTSGDVKALTSANLKKVRRVVLIVVIGFLLLCGLGIAGLVGAIFKEVNQAFDSVDITGSDTTQEPALNLHTAAGWTQMVKAIDAETGSSRVYDVVVYPTYASINAVAEEGAQRYVYRNNSFDLVTSPVTPAQTDRIDLADIDPDLVAGLPDKTAERQGMPEYDSAYLIINTFIGRPAIMVYVQQTGSLSRWSIYDFDGKVVGGTPE
ncbi:MAG: DUF1707 domain-containing protein [Aeromicrobium sp.]